MIENGNKIKQRGTAGKKGRNKILATNLKSIKCTFIPDIGAIAISWVEEIVALVAPNGPTTVIPNIEYCKSRCYFLTYIYRLSTGILYCTIFPSIILIHIAIKLKWHSTSLSSLSIIFHLFSLPFL